MDTRKQKDNPILVTKTGFILNNPNFLTKGGLDAIIFKYKPELLSQGAIVKLGPRRLWIDEARFKAWLRAKQAGKANG